jgi:hypothetical protein
MKKSVLAILICAIAGSTASAANRDPADIVRLWLRALSDGNTETLASLTALPLHVSGGLAEEAVHASSEGRQRFAEMARLRAEKRTAPH